MNQQETKKHAKQLTQSSLTRIIKQLDRKIKDFDSSDTKTVTSADKKRKHKAELKTTHAIYVEEAKARGYIPINVQDALCPRIACLSSQGFELID